MCVSKIVFFGEEFLQRGDRGLEITAINGGAGLIE